MKKNNTLTFTQKVKVADLIRAQVEPDGDRYIRYKDGLTDGDIAQRAAAMVGWPVTETNVQHLRRVAVGKIRNPGNLAGMAKAWEARRGSGKGGKAPDSKHLAAEITALRAEIVAIRRGLEAAGFIAIGIAAQ